MKKQVSVLLGSFFLFVAFLITIERTFSPHFQQCIATDGNYEQASGTIFVYARCTGLFLNDSEGAITALATIIIAAFTGTLWFATSTQANLAREAFIADKRAFVFAKGIQAFYEPDVASGHFNWRIGAVWENSGDTPTRGLQLYSDGFLSNVPIAPNFDFNSIDPNAPPANGMLGPKMVSAAGQVPHPPQPALTPQDILDVQNGSKFFYIWGWAKYYDTLPGTPQHVTRYCWRILCQGNPFTFNPLIDPSGVRFVNLYESRGNCADEECARQGLA